MSALPPEADMLSVGIDVCYSARSGHLNETTKSQQCAVYRVFRLVTCIDPPP